MVSGKIRLVLVEVKSVRLYEGQAECGELMSFLHQTGFALVAFYGWCFRHNRAARADAVFAQESRVD